MWARTAHGAAVMERDDLFVEEAPCREICDPCPSRGYSLPPRGTRRGSPFLDRSPGPSPWGRRSESRLAYDVFLEANEFAICDLISGVRLWCPSAVPSRFRLIMHEIRPIRLFPGNQLCGASLCGEAILGRFPARLRFLNAEFFLLKTQLVNQSPFINKNEMPKDLLSK